MQSYISHHPRGTVFYHLINYLSSKSCPIDLLRKISEIIENMIFSLIFVLREIWYFRQLRKIKKIWYLRWAFLWKCCFSSSEWANNSSALKTVQNFHESVVTRVVKGMVTRGNNWQPVLKKHSRPRPIGKHT